ncbi:MAG: SusE domain-containing protein [Bacteroidetes bacterium]|nr:SusE domain-containing protein [Bacteroidota bacterium]MBL6943452.1 SusE domain-containing protein [Bacteroidales bacterium]
MKKINLITTLIIGLVIFLGSCQKEETEPIMNIDLSVAAAITNPETGSVTVLTLADSAYPLLVNWTAATYSVSGGATLPLPTYSLQMAYADSNFDTYKELYNTQELVYETNVYKLNTILLQFGVPGDSTANIEFRVISGISNASYTNDTSAVIRATVTTFKSAEPPPVETPRLWVPGDYQGWNPAAAPNVWSPLNDGKYTGYVYYPEGGTYQFKFTSAPDWNHTNFGFGGEGLLNTDNGASNLSVPDFGGYILTCDTIALTWSYVVQNWGVIGSGILNGDWTEDVDLDYDMDNHVLTITIDVIEPPDASELRFKFRANDTWDINLGQGAAGTNELAPGGPDIPMPEGPGNYTFILDMSNPIPTYEFIKN